MVVTIEFLKDIQEPTLPIIRLTKSRNKTTGTATFIFIRPLVLDLLQTPAQSLEKMSLIWENKRIITSDIQIVFHKGRPFLVKSIFLFKNATEWFQFLNFMQHYSKETGLYFTEFSS